MARAPVQPELLRWARVRAGREQSDLLPRFEKLAQWEDGELQRTFKQLEAFAKATRVPLGYLFLPEPPKEELPIPDLRTLRGGERDAPSPDLLDTIHAMQRRQAWLRDDLIESGADRLEFVGSARLADDPDSVGQEMRRMVGLADGWADAVSTWQAALGHLRRSIETFGVMAVINGIVGNDTHRKLDVEEFRGFALSDDYAPLVFVNGSDGRSAQMFTMAHELAHVWLGETALTDARPVSRPTQAVESWCDRAAAEFLVPARELGAVWPSVRHEPDPFEQIARRFKVSPIVAGRRAMDLGLVSRESFFAFYDRHTAAERRHRRASSGGDFYDTQKTRVGKRFATQVMRAAKEGRISFKSAYDLTALRGGTFQEYASRLGIRMP